jgi:hypothetical protein
MKMVEGLACASKTRPELDIRLTGFVNTALQDARTGGGPLAEERERELEQRRNQSTTASCLGRFGKTVLSSQPAAGANGKSPGARFVKPYTQPKDSAPQVQ